MKAIRDGLLFIEDGRVVYSHNNEANIRDAVAGVADALGFDVQTEVYLPGWGRIDVLISDPDAFWVVEIKQTLVTPREIRAGLQQVYSYAQAYQRLCDERDDGSTVLPFLVGGTVADNARSFSAGTVYDEVSIYDAGRFMGVLIGEEPGFLRALEAQHRLKLAEQEARVRRALINRAPKLIQGETQHPDEVFAELVAEAGMA